MKLNRTKIEKILFLILSLLIFVWFCMSLFRTFFNISKIYTERSLIFASDDEKKREIFGELHPFFKFVGKTTEENSTIVFLMPNKDIDSRFYYLSYYYLYPRKLKYISQKELKNNFIFNRDVYLTTFRFLRDENINNSMELNLVGVYSGQKYIGKIYNTKK